MTNLNPTTAAIISGLRGETYNGIAFHRAVAEQVHGLVVDTPLPGVDKIVEAGLAG